MTQVSTISPISSAGTIWRNGFLQSSLADTSSFNKFCSKTITANNNISLFESQSKQNGTLTLKHCVLSQSLYFIDLLFESSIFKDLYSIFGTTPLLTNFKHFQSIGKLKSLQWHRDTYVSNKNDIGNMPPVLKLAVYTSDIRPFDPALQLIKYSHRVNFDNAIFDRLFSLSNLNKITVNARIGDYIIFDSSLLHRRRPCHSSNGYRSVTIYAFTPHTFIQSKYLACEHTNTYLNYYNSLIPQ